MRRQDMYEDMWKVFVYATLQIKKSTGDHQIQLEAFQWSIEVREVVLEAADAIQLMICEHLRPLRWLAIINSWSSDSEGAKPDRFFVANTIKSISPNSLSSDSQDLRNSDPKVKEVQEFRSLILSAASL